MKFVISLIAICLLGLSCRKVEKKEDKRQAFTEILKRYNAITLPDSFSGFSIDFEKLLKVRNRIAFSRFVTINDIKRKGESYSISGSAILEAGIITIYFELESRESVVRKVQDMDKNGNKLHISTDHVLILEVDSFTRPQF